MKRFFFLAACFSLVSCARQFAVTVNNQTVYDPRIEPGSVHVSDPGLQGCLNLALRQQRLEDPYDLSVVSCTGANVVSLEGIERFARLRFIDLADNSIADLTPLESLGELGGLNAPNNRILDVSPLLQSRTLTAANLAGNDSIPCAQLDRLESRLGPNLTRPRSCRS